MGWRFRRRLTVFPGVKINLSRSGISTTIGVPGASINIGKQGTYLNTGIPGTGIYNRTKLNLGQNKENIPSNFEQIPAAEPIIFIPEKFREIKSKDNDSISSPGLLGLKEMLLAAYKEREEIQKEVFQGEDALKYAERRLNWLAFVPFHRILFKKTLAERQKEYDECKESLLQAKQQYSDCKVSIDVDIDGSAKEAYEQFKNAFHNLTGSQYCWDITSSAENDRYKTRSAGSETVSRIPTSVAFSNLDFIESEAQGIYFKNANGADLYFYPAFLIAFTSKRDFALIDYKDIESNFIPTQFIETETIPSDSKQISTTWKYCNKNGSRDMRFSNNYQIPVMLYGEVTFKSKSGLNEAYMFSNETYARDFVDTLTKLKKSY